MGLAAQDIFDQVARHLFKQGQRSLNEDGGCVYRGPGGLQCAVGCLLTDEEAKGLDSNLTEGLHSGTAVVDLVRAGLLPDRLKEQKSLLKLLQEVHDCNSVEFWPRALRELAEVRRLSSSVVDECWGAP